VNRGPAGRGRGGARRSCVPLETGRRRTTGWSGRFRRLDAPGHGGAPGGPRVVDALLTGMHEPEASHFDLLRAFLPEPLPGNAAYREAIRGPGLPVARVRATPALVL